MPNRDRTPTDPRPRARMTVDVRRIRSDEGPTLKALRLGALTDAPEAFAQTVAEVSVKTDADWNADAGRWATASTAASFFAEVDGEVVGMGGVFVHDGRGELVAMWTRPDARRKGVAHHVIDAVVRWCREAELSELRTGVAEGNRPAAALYQSAGFEPTGEVRPLGSDRTRTERRYRRALT